MDPVTDPVTQIRNPDVVQSKTIASIIISYGTTLVAENTKWLGMATKRERLL